MSAAITSTSGGPFPTGGGTGTAPTGGITVPTGGGSSSTGGGTPIIPIEKETANFDKFSIDMSLSNEEPMPLPLEVDIPNEHLPEVLEVYDKDGSALYIDPISHVYRDFQENGVCIVPSIDMVKEEIVRESVYRFWLEFLAHGPIKFVRKYPVPVRVPAKDEEVFGDRCTVGQLDLSQAQCIGSSKHSYVFLAPFTLPSRTASSLCGEVAVKLANTRRKDHMMLEKEAMIYDKFPGELHQSTPSSVPIVPKFYGYYTPSCDSADSFKVDHPFGDCLRQIVRSLIKTTISPLLLLEPCSKPIKVDTLSGGDVDEIIGFFDRLHNARFIQGSVYQRNILVQPGPLTQPRAERSFGNPSYRLIDFGRGVCFDGDESHTADEIIKQEQQDVRSGILYRPF